MSILTEPDSLSRHHCPELCLEWPKQSCDGANVCYQQPPDHLLSSLLALPSGPQFRSENMYRATLTARPGTLPKVTDTQFHVPEGHRGVGEQERLVHLLWCAASSLPSSAAPRAEGSLCTPSRPSGLWSRRLPHLQMPSRSNPVSIPHIIKSSFCQGHQ